ncbi:LRR receptor-like kinase family protein [Medicago truncatula]|uniref:LRR receptor-like kinase family protein n=1 Tax=Medicago truncatula TaxID=3880 RepID=A0A072V6J7_MEDTR|nr:LRR receptor-like kinase family protein [Medicago truncatula]
MCTNHTVVRCNEKDRETLLNFKQGINDSLGRISTWSTKKDCCAWEGVYCDNITNRVTSLVLNYMLKGEMNLCILELEFLSYLDLSENEFHVIRIPSIQHNITHSSKLVDFDFSWNYQTLQMDNLDWLSPLSSLKYLNLNWIDLHKETNWFQVVSTLPSLFELQLSACNLNNFPSLEYLNLSSLVTLDLSNNNFTFHIPDGFFNFTKDLTCLYLDNNNIYGEIPSSLLTLQNLKHLDLVDNKLQGPIQDEIGQLAHIEYLGLAWNMLSGFIPSTLGNLSSLNYLSIGSNNFSGEISNLLFSKLSSLDSLDLSNSNFLFQFDLDWVPPFQLSHLSLGNTNQGPNFPSWIYTQKSLQHLDLSSSGISFVDRNKFSNLIERITAPPHIPNELILSNNSIAEDISNLTLNCLILRLDHNSFTGRLPNISPMVYHVDLSYNFFSGSIPHSWKNLNEVGVINLWRNRLSGEALGHLSDWRQLEVLILGENEFSGTIPINFSQNLEVVILRANQFEGTIPTQLFNLTYLFHLDLAQNKLSGSIPKCVYNLTDMVAYADEELPVGTIIELFIKSQNYAVLISPDRRIIDLSTNSLSGELPLELFRLVQVQTLNLSHNNLIGTIPKVVGDMKHMESLDLSNNKFFGEIPQSMALLNFLEVLNLSCNNFDGTIPIGSQIQTFDPSSFIGNPKLCGAPLKNCKNCTKEEENPKNAENEDDESIKESLYLGMGVGFAVGFWGICGSLFLIRKWRHAYFRFIYGVGNRLYVTLMVIMHVEDPALLCKSLI